MKQFEVQKICIGGWRNNLKKYLELLRIKHYVKNILIFMPVFFGGGILQRENILAILYSFVPFCLGASVVYIINDICDAEKDRKHPTKCRRPIASGAVKKSSAVVLLCVIIAIAALMSVYAGVSGLYSYYAPLWLLFYIALNLAYSKGLKNIPVIDVLILAAGFVIRLYYGSCVTGTEVSSWLYLTVVGGAFYLGMGKRRNEITRQNDGETREVLKKYTYDFLDKNMHVCVAFTQVCYALWAVQSEHKYLMWTVPIVMVIFMKYSLDIEQKDSEGNPVDILLSDPVLLLLALLYAVIVVISIY